MPAHEKRVKDKRIMKELAGFLAVVEYYKDRPERDDDMDVEKCFSTMSAAQRWLSKFPRDVWDGFAAHESNYREPDERKNDRKATFTKDRSYCKALRREHRANWLGGRSLVGRR